MRHLYLAAWFILITSVSVSAQMTDDSGTTEEDVQVSLVVTDNDAVFLPQRNTVDLNTDLPGRQTTANTTEGSFTVNNTGRVTFTPAPDFSGVALLQYSMVYGLLGTQVGTANITITVAAVNDAPVANNDVGSTIENSPLTLDVLSNDTDVDNALDPATISISNPVGGTFTSDNTGEVTYTPTLNFNGTATATYTVDDIAGETSAAATISITVTAVNDPPVAVNDVASTNEGVPVSIDVLTNDSDPDGTLVTSSIILSTPIGGTFIANSAGQVTYTPAIGFNGTASASYTVNDNGGLSSNSATITVTVGAVNDPPVAVNDQAVMNEDEAPLAISILTNDTDPDGQIDLSTIILSSQVNGTFAANAAGIVSYTPPLNFNGTATANYTVKDNAGALSNLATISVTVNPVNDAPVAANDAGTTDEGIAVQVNVVTNDSDADGTINVSTVVISNPVGGTFTANNTGEVSFTPTAGFNGTATASYTVKDNGGLSSNVATITITVNSVNDAPVAANDVGSMNEDAAAISLSILANDSDPDGTLDPGSVLLSGQTNGTFSVNSSGVVTFTPPANFNGSATAKYTVKDNNGTLSNQATITVTINPVNDPPAFALIDNQRVLENSASKSITITGISAGPSEIENLNLTAISANTAIVPTPVITYNGTATTATLTFKPQPNQFGSVLITVDLTDQGTPPSNKFTRTFQIEVVEVKFTSVPPTVAVPDAVYEYLVTISDVSETLSISASQKPAWLTLTSIGKNTAKLSGTPPANATISNPITLQLKDGATVLDQQQYTVVVNRVPSVIPFGLQTQEDTRLQFTVENFGSVYTDPDNHPLSEIQFTSLPKHGTLTLNSNTIAVGDKVAITSIPLVSYVPLANYNGLDTLRWKASDGYSYSQNEAYVHYVISPVNDAPVFDFVETTQLQYELGSEIPIKFATSSTITDVDDTALSGAEIGIRYLSYQPEKELLVFNDTLNIQGAFNDAAGILVLSGNASVQDYQAAIRSIKFNYINLEEVKPGMTEIYINLTDGKNIGDSKSRLIELIYTFKDLSIPNAFTPNTDDQVNATWVITSPNTPDGSVPYDDARIRVYNKHGAIVYEGIGFERPWDGSFAGEPLPSDTYYYTIELNYNRVKYRGVVTILK